MSNRRDFLKTTTGAALALSTTGVFAQGNDVIKVGDTEISFALVADPLAQPAMIQSKARTESLNPDSEMHTAEVPGVPGRELAMLQRLTAFSEKVFGLYNLQTLLETLMDEAIDLTRADKGFLILLENNDHIVVP